VIDTLAQGVWDAVHGLAPLFGDPSIVKIGHSISGLDVQSLHRDFGIFLVNAFDTYEAAKVLELKRCGLAAVCQYYGMAEYESYSALKTLYQTCDWTRRPLTAPMIRYGRYDVNFLIPLREIMMRDLTREAWSAIPGDSQLVANALQETLMQFSMEDNDEDWYDYPGPLGREGSTVPTEDTDGEAKDAVKDEDFMRPSQLDAAELRMQTNLMRVISISQDRCLKLWRKRVEPPMQNPYLAALMQRSQRGEVEWTKARIRLYNSLAQWREEVARELECLSPFVISLNFLLHLAHRRPVDEMGLLSISRSYPCILKEPLYREQIFDIIRDSFEEEDARPKITEVFLYSKRTAKRLSQDENPDTDKNRSISTLGWKIASIFVGATVLVSFAVSRSRRK
jgi:ribonuclease D